MHGKKTQKNEQNKTFQQFLLKLNHNLPQMLVYKRFKVFQSSLDKLNEVKPVKTDFFFSTTIQKLLHFLSPLFLDYASEKQDIVQESHVAAAILTPASCFCFFATIPVLRNTPPRRFPTWVRGQKTDTVTGVLAGGLPMKETTPEQRDQIQSPAAPPVRASPVKSNPNPYSASSLNIDTDV